MAKATDDNDNRIICATSIGLGGKIGLPDDVARLRAQIEGGTSADHLNVACEIAVAFIRFAQDLKSQLHQARDDYSTAMGGSYSE